MAQLTLMRTPSETALVQAFEAAKASLPGDVELRAQAFEVFNRNGLPHRRVEEFKYTDLRALMREIAPFAATPSATDSAKALARGKRVCRCRRLQVCFVNGHLVRETVESMRFPKASRSYRWRKRSPPATNGSPASAPWPGRKTIRSTSSTRPSWPMA